MTLELAAPSGGRLPDWTPGSHIDLVLPNGLTRQYSLCGDRWDAYTYRVGVLREPAGRGGSAFVHDELARGRRRRRRRPAQQLPARAVGAVPVRRRRHRHHPAAADGRARPTCSAPTGGCSTAAGAAPRWPSSTSSRRTATACRSCPQDEHGLLDLPAFLGEPRPGVRIYSCGPAPLLAAMEARLRGLAAARPAHRAVRRRRAPAPPVRTTPFEVELARTGATVTVTPDMTIARRASAGAGVEVLSSCRQGICGTCETDGPRRPARPPRLPARRRRARRRRLHVHLRVPLLHRPPRPRPLTLPGRPAVTATLGARRRAARPATSTRSATRCSRTRCRCTRPCATPARSCT